jgi:hypothetical protein
MKVEKGKVDRTEVTNALQKILRRKPVKVEGGASENTNRGTSGVAPDVPDLRTRKRGVAAGG